MTIRFGMKSAFRGTMMYENSKNGLFEHSTQHSLAILSWCRSPELIQQPHGSMQVPHSRAFHVSAAWKLLRWLWPSFCNRPRLKFFLLLISGLQKSPSIPKNLKSCVSRINSRRQRSKPILVETETGPIFRNYSSKIFQPKTTKFEMWILKKFWQTIRAPSWFFVRIRGAEPAVNRVNIFLPNWAILWTGNKVYRKQYTDPRVMENLNQAAVWSLELRKLRAILCRRWKPAPTDWSSPQSPFTFSLFFHVLIDLLSLLVNSLSKNFQLR